MRFDINVTVSPALFASIIPAIRAHGEEIN